jgi:hypothetical protein
MFLTYAPLYLILSLIIAKRSKSQGNGIPFFNEVKSFLFFLIPVFAAFTLTALIYLSPSYNNRGYGGTSLVSHFSIQNYLLSVKIFSSSALPGTIFSHNKDIISHFLRTPISTGFEENLLRHQMRAAWIVLPLFAAYTVNSFFSKRLSSSFSKTEQWLHFVLSFWLIVSPNILISLTEGHQARALGNEIIYSGTYFSLFGWVLMLVLFGNIAASMNPRLSRGLAFLTALYVAFLVYRTQIANTAIVNAQSLQHSRWRLLEQFYTEGAFSNAIKERRAIKAQGMFGEEDRFWGLFHPDYDWGRRLYWLNYSKNAFGEAIPIYYEISDCVSVQGESCQETPYRLSFAIDYNKRLGRMEFCTDIETTNCVTKEYHTVF